MGRNGFQTFGPRLEAGFAKRVVHSLSLHMAARLRVGRELNPHGGRPAPRVKSPMLYLAELPTRLSPRQHAVLYSVLHRRSGRPPDTFRIAYDPRTVINVTAAASPAVSFGR